MRYLERLLTFLPYTITEQLMKPGEEARKNIKLLKSATPAFLEWIAKKRLISAFHTAADRVPHYQRYLTSKQVDAKKINTVKNFLKLAPTIDKSGYIQTSPSLGAICLDGQAHNSSLLTKSSGFSGEPCLWPKGYAEEKEGQVDVEIGFEYLFNISKYNTLAINAFTLDAWVAGISFSRLVPGTVSLCTPGPKIEEIFDIINRSRSQYDQIMILGYPPFLKILVDRGIEAKIGWPDNRFILIPGGEGFSEGWREYINQRLGDRGKGAVFSGFGASDLGISGFIETFDSIRIRRAARSNQKLAVALFGQAFRSLPMLFQYNPMRFYITSNHQKELEFSTLSPNTLVPLIRYNLHDQGGKISYEQMRAKLAKCGLNDQIDLPLPFFYVFGRSTGEISLNGHLIYPEKIKEALFVDHKIASCLVGPFKMRTWEDSHNNLRFSIDIELKKDTKATPELNSKCQKIIHDYLLKNDEYYLDAIKKIPTAALQVKFQNEGELMSGKHIKIRYA